MELTFEQENFISDVQYEDRKLRELDLEERIVGFHHTGREIRPVYDETQKLLDEVYADIPEDDLYSKECDGCCVSCNESDLCE